MNRELIVQIEIPDYPDKIQISKSRRPVFYVNETSGIKGKTNIPKSYLNNPKYYFDDRGVLCNTESQLPQLANPRTAGQPRYFVINNQAIWNGALGKHQRNNITIALKKILYPYLKDMEVITEFPIKIDKFILSESMPVDVDNKSVIYTKCIQDLLVSLKIIPGDESEYINDTGRLKWIKSTENKMIIKIYKSDNLID